SIKNDGHYFCRAGGNRPDGLNEPVTCICRSWLNLRMVHTE
ncbi:copper resistance protein, partial [Escherichia coli]|nr:copper resistance protein [Escherichia coli]